MLHVAAMLMYLALFARQKLCLLLGRRHKLASRHWCSIVCGRAPP